MSISSKHSSILHACQESFYAILLQQYEDKNPQRYAQQWYPHTNKRNNSTSYSNNMIMMASAQDKEDKSKYMYKVVFFEKVMIVLLHVW